MTTTAAAITEPRSTDWSTDLEPWRCPRCEGALEHHEGMAGEALLCRGCSATFPIREGILVVEPGAKDNNAVAQRFYDSPLWPKFRFWEWLTFLSNGGERRSRQRVLRHLPTEPGLRLLDVAIGDGVYLDWLPESWSVAGVDISWTQLQACADRPRAIRRPLKLAQCPAEILPFGDGQFDAALSIGAFNYVNDPERVLREMVRVTRPGGTIVVSDELPNLTDRMLGRKLGLPGLDRWIVSRLMNLGDDFTDVVERHRDLDIQAIAARVLPGCRYETIWRGVGYVFRSTVPVASC